MTSDAPELGEDESRVDMRMNKAVRQYLRERKEETNHTYSQLLDEWIPDEVDDAVALPHQTEIVRLKLVPGVHSRVDALATSEYSHREVVAFYAMLAAIENGDLERVPKFAQISAELVMEAFRHERV